MKNNTRTSLAALVAAMAALASSTHAQIIIITNNPPTSLVVSNTFDSGPGSLREAITQVAAVAAITFAPGLTGTITLTSGELVVGNTNLSIIGPGANLLSISGNNASRVFNIRAGSLNLSGLTIQYAVRRNGERQASTPAVKSSQSVVPLGPSASYIPGPIVRSVPGAQPPSWPPTLENPQWPGT